MILGNVANSILLIIVGANLIGPFHFGIFYSMCNEVCTNLHESGYICNCKRLIFKMFALMPLINFIVLLFLKYPDNIDKSLKL